MADIDNPNDRYIQALGYYMTTADNSRNHRYAILFAMLGSSLFVNLVTTPQSSPGTFYEFLLLTALYVIAIHSASRGEEIAKVIKDLELKLQILPSTTKKSLFDSKFSISFAYAVSIAGIAGNLIARSNNISETLASFIGFLFALIATLILQRII